MEVFFFLSISIAVFLRSVLCGKVDLRDGVFGDIPLGTSLLSRGGWPSC